MPRPLTFPCQRMIFICSSWERNDRSVEGAPVSWQTTQWLICWVNQRGVTFWTAAPVSWRSAVWRGLGAQGSLGFEERSYYKDFPTGLSTCHLVLLKFIHQTKVRMIDPGRKETHWVTATALFTADRDPRLSPKPALMSLHHRILQEFFIVSQRDTEQQWLMLPPVLTWAPHHSLCYYLARKSKSGLAGKRDKQKLCFGNVANRSPWFRIQHWTAGADSRNEAGRSGDEGESLPCSRCCAGLGVRRHVIPTWG